MATISLPITSLTAIACGVIFLALTRLVIRLRRRDGVVLGDNGDRVLAKAIRGQANAAEQMPIALVLMLLAELQGGFAPVLAVLAVIFVLGRAAHALYFGRHGTHWRFRFLGMSGTLLAQAGLLIMLLVVTL